MRASFLRQVALSSIAIALLPIVSYADFIPISLSADSFNHDVIVEKTAPPPIVPVTTASMDSGITNTGFGWYEKGYNALWPGTGLPAPGSIIQSDALADNTYQLAPTYKTNNAVLIDATLTNAALTATVPAKFARLSFLLASGNGSGSIRVTVHYQDSSTDTFTNTCPDWLATAGEALFAAGRVDVREFQFDGVSSSYPCMFTRDVSLSHTGTPVTSIQFSYISGAAHVAVFAVSASTNLVDAFSPLPVSGYSADLIVEASATRRESLGTATSASMEGGTINGARTWYERGYYPPAPATGLPPAGSLLTNSLAPDHVFAMPSSYTSNNALVIDSLLDTGVLIPTTPAAYSALSFLCASGHGPVTNQCVIQHANGAAQTNNLVVPDWFDNSPAAFTASGDLNLNTRMTDSVGANYPRLFAVDLALANSTSPVTNVLLSFTGGASNSHCAILALSGLPAQSSGIRAALSISRLPSGNIRISSSQPGLLQSTTALNGANTIWQNEGIISTTIDTQPASGLSAKFYRVVGQ